MTVKLSTGFRNALCVSSPIIPLMYGGTILVCGGTMPNSPDDALGTSILARITTDGLTFIPSNTPTAAGLTLNWVSPGYIVMAGNWVLKSTGLSGTATWFRWCWRNTDDNGFSNYYPRLDGDVGDVLIMSDTEITTNRITKVEAFVLSIPLGG